MIVITADQRSSRTTPDAAAQAIADLARDWAGELLLAPERSAGDEIQVVVAEPGAALGILLALTRTERWSVGLGVGDIDRPLGANARESTGAAFVAARRAVERAKKRPTHFALASEPGVALAVDVEALIDLLLLLRERRTEPGWELHDLLAAGGSQVEAARTLAVTPQSVSARAHAAGLRAEQAATVALRNMLGMLDRQVAG